MKLIPISPNILINPDCISCIEQREIKGTDVTYVWIGDKHYVLAVPLDEFYASLGLGEMSQGGQHWAG